MSSRPPQRPGAPQGQPEPSGPPVDLLREGNALVVMISVPGMKAGDFRLSLVGSRQLYIEGTVPYRHPVPKEGLVLAERPYGPFTRTIGLPLPVSSRGATVSLDRGVLMARLPLQLERLQLHWG